MRNFRHLSALVLAVATPALAQAPTMRAEFAASQDANREVIVDGRLWNCNGTACTAQGSDARPAVACRKLGPVTRFATAQSELDAAGLAACNQDHK